MRKFIVAGVAALIGATSFAGSANADVVFKYRNGWHRPHGPVVVLRPRARVYVAPRVVYRDCVVRKRINRWGEVVRKRYC